MSSLHISPATAEDTTDYPFGRVLLVDLSHQTGGASMRTLSLLAALPAGMASLAVIENSAVAREAIKAGLPTHIIGQHKTSLSIRHKLQQVIVKGNYGIVDTQNAQSQCWVALAGISKSTALVSTLNSWYRDEYGITPRGMLYHSIVMMTRTATDHYITVSTPISDHLLSSNVSQTKISRISPAIDLPPDKVPDKRSLLRDSFGLQHKDILLCSVGRLVAAKDYPCLIQAMQLLPSHIHLAIAGDGPLKETLKRLVQDAALSNRIHFMGSIQHSEALSLIKAADIFVLSSTTEGTPVVLMEAAALECPIVATKVGGIPDLFAVEGTASLVPPANPSTLADALLSASNAPNASIEMGRRARISIQASHGISVMVNSTLNAYQKAWNQHNKRQK